MASDDARIPAAEYLCTAGLLTESSFIANQDILSEWFFTLFVPILVLFSISNYSIQHSHTAARKCLYLALL